MSDDAHIRYISLHCGLPEGPLREIAKDLRGLSWNLKHLGQVLAAQVARETDWTPPNSPFSVPLTCQASTQSDMQSKWFSYWCHRLGLRPIFHRKLWEYAYIVQGLWERGFLTPEKRGLGFGCGTELFPAFFASCGASVLATDLHPEKVAGMGWAETNQHTEGLEMLYRADLLERSEFDRLVELRFVDMNQIPQDLHSSFDFTWSMCALEHLGSIQHGLDFIKESVRCLKPGGIAIHTTEFNFAYEDETLESQSCVLFRKKDFEALAAELEKMGHVVSPLNFDVGRGCLDGFIDVPPYKEEETPLTGELTYHPLHLKLMLAGFPSTCFGLIIKAKS
jgi:SAM-dependent methyltransferase